MRITGYIGSNITHYQLLPEGFNWWKKGGKEQAEQMEMN